MNDDRPILESYVKLALAIDRHARGYVDAYFGPEEWRTEAEESDPVPLMDLIAIADDAIGASSAFSPQDNQRRVFISKQLQSMLAILHILAGNRLSVRDETLALYDIETEWCDESEFIEAQQTLDQLLPSGGSLYERAEKRRSQTHLSQEDIQPLFETASKELRDRTKVSFSLPETEEIEFKFVTDKPWAAYNWYLGNYQSRVEINVDLPWSITSVLDFVAHEAYPGHHTELSTKEYLLFRNSGRAEHCICPLNAPAATVSEGIAERALSFVGSDEEWIEWSSRILYPAAGKDHLDARQQHLIKTAYRKLDGVLGNAVYLIHDHGKSDDEVVDYLREYSLCSEKSAKGSVRFIRTPQFRTYSFLNRHGGMLLDELFRVRGNMVSFARRLLSEPVTPSQIRNWIEGDSALVSGS